MRSSKNKKLSKKKADTYFAKYIRFRDQDKGCCTCGKHIGSYYSDGDLVVEGDCGHFITRENETTRYDEKNCALQCHHCNRFKGGKQYEFSIYIDKRWGKGTAEKLLIQSKMRASARTQYDYEMIALKYREKLKEVA